MKIEIKLLNEVDASSAEKCIKIFEVKGCLDRSNVEDFKKNILVHLSNSSSKLVLDFHLVDFCDSTGLTSLIELTNKAKEKNGFLRLVAVPDKIKQVLHLLGLHIIITVFDTINDALVN